MLSGRWKWKKKFKTAVPAKKDFRIWFHCASLGEFEMARPIIERTQQEQPQTEIIISFFSPSGYEQMHNYPVTAVVYLPLDFRANARNWYKLIQPDVAVFVKYEFWLNYMREGLAAGVKMLAFGCLFREGQFIFEPWASAWKRCLQEFNAIFVQNAGSAEIGKVEGLRNLQVNGDLRFDRVLKVRENNVVLPEIEQYKAGSVLCLLGSCWPAEEKLLLRYVQNNGLPVNSNFILVPHDISERHIQTLCNMFSEYGCIRYSDIKQSPTSEKVRFLIVDVIGVLAPMYRYADVVVIGGAWGKGLHNMLEAAVWGMPVLFGPKHQKFPEAAESIEAGFGFECTDYDSFERNLKNALGNPESRAAAAQKSRDFVTGRAGATSAVVAHIETLRKG